MSASGLAAAMRSEREEMLVIDQFPLEPALISAGDTEIQRGKDPSPEHRNIRVLRERNGGNANTTAIHTYSA
jgi:hypothetical protein